MKDFLFILLMVSLGVAFCLGGYYVSSKYNFPLSEQSDLELRLMNLEELHTVTIENKRLTIEHTDVPTSCTAVYIKIPMDQWVKYEHLLGR